MNNAWRKRFLTTILATAMIGTSAVPAFAEAAPDGKNDASQLAEAMGTEARWESWKTNWETLKNDWTQISLTPGSDMTQLNFAWYSPKTEGAETTAPTLIIGEGRNMKNAQTYTAQQTDGAFDENTNTAYWSNKVTAEGLKAGTTYYYSYEKENGSFTEPVPYQTQDADSYRFLFVGDPQIGSSNELKGEDTEEFYQAQSDSVRSDAFNWESTLNAAMEMAEGQVGFVLSAGDQVQTSKKKAPGESASVSEIEYAGYLSPEILKSLPVATSVGNHDADNPNYTYHFNTPNNSTLGSNGIVGGDYSFTYGNTLFMVLNTQDTEVTEHKEFIEQAVAANPECTWRVVTLHQDIYGSAEHSNEPEITNLRYNLIPYFEENDIDVVFSGHDHAYSRSKLLKGGQKTMEYTDDAFDEALDKDMDAGENPVPLFEAPGNISADSEDPADQEYLHYLEAVMDKDAIEETNSEADEESNSEAAEETDGKAVEEADAENASNPDGETVVNPEGILYMTAGSASGSKHYDLVPRTQAYTAQRWQEDIPTYSIVEVTADTFTIDTYRTDTNEKIDSSFTIKKTA